MKTNKTFAILSVWLLILSCLYLYGFTYTLDCATPVGTDAPSVLDDKDRETKSAFTERLNVDHYWELTGTQVSDAAAGQHRQIEFYGPISTPTNAANKMFFYAKDVDSVVEGHILDESGNEIQLTSGGILNSANLTGNQTIAGVKTFSSTITSNLATGTAPLTVASTTVVDNLNVDQVDGYDVAAYTGGQSYTFPGGLILKHGTKESTSDDLQTFTFGSAFPNSCISVTLTRGDAGASLPLAVYSISTTNFKINRHDDMDGTVDFYWQAIGY